MSLVTKDITKSMLNKYDNHNQIHVGINQERHFLRISKTTPSDARERGFGVGGGLDEY